MKKSISILLLLLSLTLVCSEESTFFEWCLATKEPVLQPYHPIISLGFNCQVAYQLRIHGLRYEAFPFDWVICPFDALISLLEDDFKYFLEPDYLKFINSDNQKHILNTYYGIKFLHDFRLSEAFMEDYKEVKETFRHIVAYDIQRYREYHHHLLIIF